jgi:alkylation response protein AidB-like acyl-CoA dehydrogenase
MPVDLTVTEEQQALRDTVRRLLADKASPAARRRLIDTEDGFDPRTWAQLAELGLHALIIPESYGGLGQGGIESWVVFAEMGRALYSGPFLATVALAANALLLSADDAIAKDLLPRIAGGEIIAALAVAGDDGRWDGLASEQVTARPGPDGWVLDGAKTFVIDGMAADLLLVTARSDAGLSLFAVDADAPGVDRRRLEALDLTRRLAAVSLSQTPGRLVGVDGEAEPVIGAVYERALAAVAAEQAGGMRACLDLCVDYAKQRKQFGAPIGSFQAVAHRCVDMLQRTEFAESAAHYAAAAQGTDEGRVAARVAAAYSGRAYHWVTAETIQIHGGLGFTWDHDAHLYYRRCRSTEQLFGSQGRHLDALADLVGL